MIEIIALILGVMLFILKGFVFMKLWQWFIVTSFNISPLNLATALGIMLIVGFLTEQSKQSETKTISGKVETLKALIRLIVSPIITLFLGWIIHYFV